MRIRLLILTLLIGVVLAGLVGWQSTMAQEDEYILAHTDVFGKLRRPPVVFSHESHAESLGDESCGLCHHTPDDETGRLAYVDGDERSCTECHGMQKEDRIPALREAFHGNCTSCHRNRTNSHNLKSGPTTCGGCHRKT